MRILVLGYFGYITNQLDGQTIKTRDIYSLLRNRTNYNIRYFDTQVFKKSKASFFTLLVELSRADVVLYLPAHGNLKYLFPVVFCFSKLSRTDINYIVVGGWLIGFLKNKPLHRWMISKIKGVYVETEDLFSGLKNYGMTNVGKLYNFRTINYPVLLEEKEKDTIDLVFMARVHPMKGVDTLFKLDHYLNENNLSNITITIYGPILDSYKGEFLNKIRNSSIAYAGVLDPNEIHNTLIKYDLMLFPTEYYTEGFPGSILDAYISGLPVIATHWKNADEFIREGQTGFISKFNDSDAFIQKVLLACSDRDKLRKMKQYVAVERIKYNIDAAMNILIKAIR